MRKSAKARLAMACPKTGERLKVTEQFRAKVLGVASSCSFSEGIHHARGGGRNPRIKDRGRVGNPTRVGVLAIGCGNREGNPMTCLAAIVLALAIGSMSLRGQFSPPNIGRVVV